MSLYRTAVNKPVTVALIFVALAIMGIFSLINLSIDLYPKITANMLFVMCYYPNASAADVETNLTKVLENGLNAVSDLKNITSQSKENYCLVNMEFKSGIDIDVAANDVRDKLDLVSTSLPDNAGTPLLFKFGTEDMPVLIYSISAKESLAGLEKILDDQVSTPLARVSGVGSVTIMGAPQREIQVYCDPNKLEAYNLTIDGISGVLAYENRNVPSGNLDIGSNTYSLRVEKEFSDPSEMLDVVVGYSAGKAVYLRDVARVVDGEEERSQEAYADGTRSALVAIQKQSDANSVDVIRGIKAELKEIRRTLPPDIEFVTIMDTSRNILNSAMSLLETILITFLVVMLVVYLFLGRWSATFIIITAIPISLLSSLMYLFFTGNTLNMISMSALSIAIGMVVDDAIVVLENVTTHLERGEKPKEAAVHATSEVGISVIASTLTMLAVFLPLTMISGMAGIMFRQLGWIVSIIMIVSTTGALTLIPMLCSRFLSVKKNFGALNRFFIGNFNKFIDWLSRAYAKFINLCMHHRTVVVCITVGIFAVCMFIFAPKMKTAYFPSSDSGTVSIAVTLPAGTGQDVTRAMALELYDRFKEAAPELKAVSFTLGQASDDNVFATIMENGVNYISYNMDFGSIEDRKRTTGEISDVFRAILAEYPEIKKATVTEGMGFGGTSSVDLEVYCYDFAVSDEIAEKLRQGMLESGCCSEVTISRDEYSPEYQVDFDRVKLATNGLNSTTAASYLMAAVSGSVGSYYREEGEEYNIRVRYAPEFRRGLEDIENILVYNSSGKAIRIKDLGTVVEAEVPPTIERKNRERVNTVNAVVGEGYALSDVVEVSRKVIDATDIPRNVQVEIAGDYVDQQEMFSQMGILLLLIVILVYIVMAAQFESFMGPFVIMFSIPFAFIGVVFGLLATNTPLSVVGMIGVLILVGIVVKNGIVLIDYTILCRERGMSIIEASTVAARSRLRPILMTALTTILGMVPMAIGLGEGSEIWKSLGITVAWGLSVSTLVTLIFIPVLYCSFATWQERSRERKAARAAAV